MQYHNQGIWLKKEKSHNLPTLVTTYNISSTYLYQMQLMYLHLWFCSSHSIMLSPRNGNYGRNDCLHATFTTLTDVMTSMPLLYMTNYHTTCQIVTILVLHHIPKSPHELFAIMSHNTHHQSTGKCFPISKANQSTLQAEKTINTNTLRANSLFPPLLLETIKTSSTASLKNQTNTKMMCHTNFNKYLLICRC